MSDRLRIGTRGSPLALAQAELVRRALQRTGPELTCEIVPLRTAGDRAPRALRALDFTDGIDARLEAGEVDLAVHSAKDLPAEPVRSVVTAAYLRREDPRDCLVLRGARRLRDLPAGARLGSSSRRRESLLRFRRPDLVLVPIRGNIDTRIARLGTTELDGIILAAAGLRRMGWEDRISEHLPARWWLPAPGQGAIAIECRRGDRFAAGCARRIDHAPTHAAVSAERAAVRALGGGCDLPLGALARTRAGRIRLDAILFSSDGAPHAASRESADLRGGERLGRLLGKELRPFAPSPA